MSGNIDNVVLPAIHAFSLTLSATLSIPGQYWDLRYLYILLPERQSRIFKVFRSSYLYGYIDEFNLFTIKFHMLDHVADDVQSFVGISFSGASPFEHFNTTIWRFIKITLRRRGSAMEEALCATNNLIADGKCNSIDRGRKRTTKLVKDGMEMSLRDILFTNANAFVHSGSEFKTIFIFLVLENIQECFNLTYIVPLQSVDFLMIVKFEIIHGVTNVYIGTFQSRCYMH